MTSAPGEPPGSRVRITPKPADVRRSASSVEWVDLPVPSPPSKVMNRPRIVLTGDGRERPQRCARRAIRPVPSRFLLSRRYRSKTDMPGITDEPTQSAQVDRAPDIDIEAVA